MPELWLVETADRFWREAGGYTPKFEEAILFSLPLSIERLDALSVHRAQTWLWQRGFALPGLNTVPNRRLRACLVAHGSPCNFVLLDKADPPAEQLFSLAHEISHFLLDYLRPRQKAERHLTASILEVLDGLRPPTLEERLHGLLEGVWIGQYEHFMERDSGGNILSRQILQAEDRADRLALELLAPEELVLPKVTAAITGKSSFTLRLEVAIGVLTDEFNLPFLAAKSYAAQLVKLAGGETTFREWLNF